MKRKFILYSFLLVFLGAFFSVVFSMMNKNHVTHKNNSINEVLVTKKLDSAIYNDNKKIEDLKNVSDKALIKKSNKFFLKGLLELEKNNNYLAAIQNFENALMLKTSAEVYMNLSYAWVKNNNLDLASICLYRADQLCDDDVLKGELYYRKAVLSTLKKESIDEIVHNLYNFIDSEKGNMDRIDKDGVFDEIRNDEEFLRFKVSQIKEDDVKKKESFKLFWKENIELSEIVIIDSTKIYSSSDQKNMVPWMYVDYIPGMAESDFGRDVSAYFFKAGRLPENNGYKAALFTMQDLVGDNSFFGTSIVTYSESGEVIDNQEIASVGNPVRYKKCEINGSMITVNEYEIVWDKDPALYGFRDNFKKSTKFIKTYYYHIQSNGQIEEVNKTETKDDESFFSTIFSWI